LGITQLRTLPLRQKDAVASDAVAEKGRKGLRRSRRGSLRLWLVFVSD
jgi:hypothetical protein